MSDSRQIPTGWSEKRLRDVAEVNPPRPKVEDDNLLVSFIRMEDVSEDAKIVGGTIKPYFEVSKGYTAFQEGDLLIAKITPCFENGKGALAQGLSNGIGFGSTEFHILRAKSESDVNFLYYITLSHEFRGYGELNMHGSAGQKRVPTHFIKNYRFLCPPLPEQRAIAAILGMWDRAIALTEWRLAAAEQRKKALMQKVLTGRVRFPEFVKSTERQETKYGDLPADWKYVPLRQVAREMKTRNAAEHDYPVLSCTKYNGLVDSLEYFGRQIYSDDLSTYKVVRERQFAYATNHIEEGSIGYQDLHKAALISPMYTVFETNDRVDDSFLYKVLKTEKYRHIFEVNTNGTVNRRGSLRWDEFSQIHIPLPSLPEQRRIAAILNACDREVDLLRRKRDALQQQKKGLMQRLLTGRVRIKV